MCENPEKTIPRANLDLSKVFRLRAMLHALRTEVRDVKADEASLQRLASIHNEIESQLVSAIPTELEAELAEFSACCHDNPNPSKPEIRVAQAQTDWDCRGAWASPSTWPGSPQASPPSSKCCASNRSASARSPQPTATEHTNKHHIR